MAAEVVALRPEPCIFFHAGLATEFIVRAFFDVGLENSETFWMMAEASCHLSKLRKVGVQIEAKVNHYQGLLPGEALFVVVVAAAPFS